MGYPILISHPDRDVVVQAVKAYAACLRRHGRRVTAWPIIKDRAGQYSCTLDVCGTFDKTLDTQCAPPGLARSQVDLRPFSPGQKNVGGKHAKIKP